MTVCRLAPLLAVAVLLVAGCGGGASQEPARPTPSSDEYLATLTQLEREMRVPRERWYYDTDTPKQVRGAAAGERDAFRLAVRTLRATQAPPALRSQHQRLIVLFDRGALALGRLLKKPRLNTARAGDVIRTTNTQSERVWNEIYARAP